MSDLSCQVDEPRRLMANQEQPDNRSHNKAILQAMLVTFLWASSWVLIKIGLQSSLPAITFGGLRYSLAFLILIPFVLTNPAHKKTLATLSRATWARLALLGVLLYTLTQGAQFVGLALLPAATLTLLLNLTPIAVALFSGILNNESPSAAQWRGMGLSVLGTIIFFYPLSLPARQTVGLVVGLFGILTNAAASLLGRQVNRGGHGSPLVITTVSMGIGGLLLLVAGAATQGFGELGPKQWAIIAWLAIVNTAVAFTLWNHTLRTLTAVESSVINNLMLPQIAILAWAFLDEPLNLRQIAGLILVGVGTLLVQLRRGK